MAAPITQETKIKQKRVKHALLNATNANSAAESSTTTTTRCIQNTYGRDAVLSNEKDEPKMTKQQQQHVSLFAHVLQLVRFAPLPGEQCISLLWSINHYSGCSTYSYLTYAIHVLGCWIVNLKKFLDVEILDC